MSDPVTRSAARLAVLVAIPIAVLAGVGFFALLSNAATPDDDPPPAAPPPAAINPDPVVTEVRELDEWPETVCRAVLSQLPSALDGMGQRPVTEGPEQNAAFGDPPVMLACGVPAVEVDPTETVYPLPAQDGVCWRAAEEPDRTIWTTLDREVTVQITVPSGYDGPGQLVTELSPTIASTVRGSDTAPSGCGSS